MTEVERFPVFSLPRELRAGDIAKLLQDCGAQVRGDASRVVRGVASLHAAVASDGLGFCSTPGKQGAVLIKRAMLGVVLCTHDTRSMLEDADVPARVHVDDPRRAFALCMEAVGAGGPRGFTAPRSAASIARGSSIAPSATICEGVTMGRHCVIQPGAVIGADGFGFVRLESGDLKRFPHFGSVFLSDRVEVGANATIDRGALAHTLVGDGTKIDDGAYIAHHVMVGRDCLIMAGAILCGGCSIGDGAEVSPGAVVREGVAIGNGAKVGLGAVVVKDVMPGDVVAGVPARSL